jgi:hypothetical protein
MTLKTNFGEISVEGDSKREILALLEDALSLAKDTKISIPPEVAISATIPTLSKKELEGIIEVTADGKPQITVPPAELAAKDVIGLLLYWKYPEGVSVGELTSLVSLNWKSVDQRYVAANIGKMKGLLLREGPKGKYIFKLSGAGKSWVEKELLPKIKEKRK